MKIGVLEFGGTNCDLDVLSVLRGTTGVDAERVWYKDAHLLDECDGLVIPGGFSYGDYLRAGAIAARAPITDKVRQMASDGLPVLGICNGFQVLTEAGILKGALVRNDYPKFLCTWCHLRVEAVDCPFTMDFEEGSVIHLPIAHKEGRYYTDEDTLGGLRSNGQVALKYSDEQGNVSKSSNPNGSVDSIAGVLNERKNVLGLMPHPERACEAAFGSEDGKAMFSGMVEYIRR
ncbi:MAG: phosphoribosylformylglycinamidine synthase I [Methermicoccaceae archaeon]